MVDFSPEPEDLAETSRISIDVEGIDLPTDTEVRKAVLNEITEKVDQIIEEEGLSANNARAHTGHRYTQIPPDCPECEHPLTIRRPWAQSNQNEELAGRISYSIYCSQCGYDGGCEYRLTDIQTNKYDSEAKAETYRSEVNDRRIFPEYHSY